MSRPRRAKKNVYEEAILDKIVSGIKGLFLVVFGICLTVLFLNCFGKTKEAMSNAKVAEGLHGGVETIEVEQIEVETIESGFKPITFEQVTTYFK